MTVCLTVPVPKLLAVSVDIEKDGETIPAKLVYVRNKSRRKDWLVLEV